MAKYISIVNMLKSRILHGDYAIRDLPTERQLAQEVSVSYMTARRALKMLESLGLAIRMPNGRLKVNDDSPESPLITSIALLIPSVVSSDIARWHATIHHVASQTGNRIRPIVYSHWDDVLLLDTLDGFRGVFLLSSNIPMPPHIISRLQSVGRLVVVGEDMSQYGLPSLRLFPPIAIQCLLDHLETLGHQQIACLNTQPECLNSQQRIEQWQLWMAAHGFTGTLINHPVCAYGDTREQSYRVMSRILRESGFADTALVATTMPAAVGAMRALHEAGRYPGHDIAVCTVNGEGDAAFHIPSLTAVEAPDPQPYLSTCLEWMTAQHEAHWTGPLLLQPAQVPLVIRESTVPVRS